MFTPKRLWNHPHLASPIKGEEAMERSKESLPPRWGKVWMGVMSAPLPTNPDMLL